jgi:hypothetical protein
LDFFVEKEDLGCGSFQRWFFKSRSDLLLENKSFRGLLALERQNRLGKNGMGHFVSDEAAGRLSEIRKGEKNLQRTNPPVDGQVKVLPCSALPFSRSLSAHMFVYQ